MWMIRTWDSIMSMLPKGGEPIWGGLDLSPEDCSSKKHKHNDTEIPADTGVQGVDQTESFHYGRIISLGKDVAKAHSSALEISDVRNAIKGSNFSNGSCNDVWTEYQDMGPVGIKAVVDHKVFTAGSLLDLHYFVAPKLMKRGDAHFSYGIADNLDDPKYKHYKYWSNPLETKYHHPQEKLVIEPAEAVNFLGLPMRPGERECPFYMRTGSCKFASNCRFHHPDPTAGGSESSYDRISSVPFHVSAPQSVGAPWSVPRPPTDVTPYLNSSRPYMPTMLQSQVHSPL